ncbi:MFS general substrate transporter [Dichomitus squalens]|uniref:MFS general substrate transporter n=1 Tax=Dichomitus squalens TaxID=114155 RepID=A0A4Q9MI48_9APHY|nr:MFS general substrate transporter [Dichomitus squalens]
MVFGILDDHKLERVPGTGLLSDRRNVHGPQVTTDQARELKHGTGTYSHIVLIPQPSDDPRDPLNWPRWKKEACFWTLIFATSLAGVLSPVASAGYTLLAEQFHVSVDEITSSFGALVLGLGIFMGPLIYGYVIQNLSWQLGFWFTSIACGLSFIGVFFCVPEATMTTEVEPQIKENASRNSIEKTLRKPESPDVESFDRTPPSPSPPTFLSQLKVYNGRLSEESVWKILLSPWPFVLSPVTWFVFLTYSMQTVWLSLVPLCSSTIFTIEYNFDAAQVGLTNLGGIVGIVLAMLVTGPLNDWGIVWISQRNRGVYEPEYRLMFMIGMLFGVFGYVGWAVGNDQHMPWIGAVACITMLNFSMVVSGSAAVTYLLDTHRANALHILSITNFAKNMVLYGSTFFANGIVISRGVKVALLILGACQAFCWLASVPMYIYGKRVRSFIARHPRLFRGDLPASEFPAGEHAERR